MLGDDWLSGQVQRLTSPEDEMGFTITITVKKIKYTVNRGEGGLYFWGLCFLTDAVCHFRKQMLVCQQPEQAPLGSRRDGGLALWCEWQ